MGKGRRTPWREMGEESERERENLESQEARCGQGECELQRERVKRRGEGMDQIEKSRSSEELEHHT